MPKKESFLVNRLKSVGYAFKGTILLITKEPSIKIQLVIAIAVTIAGFYFDISKTEWGIQILAIALVMSVEGVNTAVEEIANFIHPEYHEKIGYIKDIAAGAVFIAAICAIALGCIIYIPKVF
ncbi:diacylglycerol kinase [Jejuia pallidilutea]|uniref:Diacylglycerol kinase n=1 Tax=Jejuia pallidilutea TaxID=504487 RepID=A0A090W7U9_9FLAO|nr:diacylglycerol kinase family protein [Jejuia pallidilutea]PQV50417.1 diacylglycerol kinase (ATP) [Jejuia pallidilutea]GAL65875.1 diacylglycerol kinase [Jejuia pallidilutea]GAL71509.1 diacylglycerol kinase [Jejuia pallidilutea]GAL88488.1 diacylglycerol kinase [Jejuia pallidilutea]